MPPLSMQSNVPQFSRVTHAQQMSDAISPSEETSISKHLPLGTKIVSVRRLIDSQPESIAVLVSGKRGREIVVLSAEGKSSYRVKWTSGTLPASFDVAAPALELEKVGSEKVIGFSGCTAHRCPDIFSSLLYVPSLQKAFTATCQSGQTKYSFTESPSSAAVRRQLMFALKEADTYRTACNPEIDGLAERVGK